MQIDTPNNASHAIRYALLHEGRAVTNQSQAHPIARCAIIAENTHCRRARSTHSRRGCPSGCSKGGTRVVDELLRSEARDGHELSDHPFAT